MPSTLILRFVAAMLVLAVVPAAPCPAAPRAIVPGKQRPPDVTWSFQQRTDRDSTPHTDVFLRVPGRRILIVRGATDAFTVVGRRDYAAHAVPSDAVAACSGWWAGQGMDLYVVRRGQRLTVFSRGLDEEAPIPAYARLKSVSLRHLTDGGHLPSAG